MIDVLFGSGLRVREVDVGWRVGVFLLVIDESRLEMDDVFPQRVVFGLDGFVVFLEYMVFAHLLLKLFDVAFFALTECALCCTVLGGPIVN